MTSLPIAVPEGFTLLVAVGNPVTAGQVIAHLSAPRDESVNVMEGLNVNRKQAQKALLKSPGDQVKKGDAIALKKNFFGKQTGAIVSGIDGTILRYERDTGNLIIRMGEEVTANELISPVDGTVNLCNNKEIVIQTDNAVTGGRVVSGSINEGELFILEASFISETSPSAIFSLDSQAIGKIVLGGKLTREVLIKGVGIGTAGFIGTEILDQDIFYLQEKNINTPVIEIDIESMERLKKRKGKKVRLDAQSKTIVFIRT